MVMFKRGVRMFHGSGYFATKCGVLQKHATQYYLLIIYLSMPRHKDSGF